VVVKRGEYGALMVSNGSFFFVPAYPMESVHDPTGAGDAFAGGFMGHLAKEERTDPDSVRRAIVFGSVMASFTVEDFSLNRLLTLKPEEIERRYASFQDLVRFEI
jgi:sugar/nucleoside kinase (ribokinase family)